MDGFSPKCPGNRVVAEDSVVSNFTRVGRNVEDRRAASKRRFGAHPSIQIAVIVLSRRVSMMDVFTALTGPRRIQLFDMNGHQNYKEIPVNVCKGIDIFSLDKYRAAAPPDSMGISSLSTNHPYCH